MSELASAPAEQPRPAPLPTQFPSPHGRFLAGDPVPMFHTATDGNPRYAFDSVAGR